MFRNCKRPRRASLAAVLSSKKNFLKGDKALEISVSKIPEPVGRRARPEYERFYSVKTLVKPKEHLPGSSAARDPGSDRAKPKRARGRDNVSSEPPNQPAIGTLARTKSLLLAALRVWELKRGLRE